MNRLPKSPHPFSGLSDCFLAGGAILSAVTKTEPADYDLYPKSKKAAIDLIYYLMEEEDCFVVNISDRAVTLKCNGVTNEKGERVIVQVMMFDEFKTAEQIFDFFDFSVCMGAWDCDTKEYVFHDDFLVDIASKTLRFNPATKFPLNSMMRIGKYRNKGYTLPTSEMIRMSLTLMQSDLPTSWKELESAIGGTYGRQVKLHTADMEFSIENALKLFDDLDVDVLLPDLETDYSNIKAEDFVSLFEDKLYRYDISNNSGYSNLVYRTGTPDILINEDGVIITDIRGILELADIFGVELEEYSKDKPLMGYKTFVKNTDGTLSNTINSKKLVYKIGEWTEEPKAPHIYVHPSASKTYRGDVYKVEYLVDDIVTASSHELTVKKVKVLEKM